MASDDTCITSKQFVTILKKFDKDGNGHIEKSKIDSFLKAFEDEGLIEHARLVEIAEKIKEESSDENVITVSTIWDNYDVDGNGYLDQAELRKFFYDLITKNDSHPRNPKDLKDKIDQYIEAMFRMYNIRNGKCTLEDMCKFCPVEENFLEQYEQFNEEEIDEIFAHYDQDDSHEIEGYELEGFLNDLYQKKHKPGVTFEKFKEKKMKAFDKDKNKKFNKKELEKILNSP
ncbi:calbindin-32-like isoform X2 [Porites lutea]|uniref:calbindin-32-like isoform X2 n=1 Tax=Porites lutea TaxID=51062 RepID=UPI003CC5E2C6